MFDAHPNLAVGYVLTPPSPATSGTTLVLRSGQGASFEPDMPATLAPADQMPAAATSEIVYITAVDEDTLTVLRAQEGTTAKQVRSDWAVYGSATAKTFTDIEEAAQASADDLEAHASNISNPHQVTKTQVGLGNVDNTSDVSKPVSTATQAALASHTADVSNPHSVTKTQVGLGNADNTSDANKPVSTAQAAADALKVARAGDTMTGPLHMQSSESGGPDATDSTSRVTIESYQTNGDHNYGEGIRLDLMNPVSKNMIAWRMRVPVHSDEPFIMGPTNRGFETDTSGWTVIGGGSFARNAAQHASGSYSGKLIMATGASGSQGVSNTVTGLTIGRQYFYYAWVYIPTSAPAMVTDVDGTFVSTASSTINSWTQLAVSWTASATSHTIRVMSASASTSGQFVYIDETYVTPEYTANVQAVAWAGAHAESQNMTGPHGHWSLEAPDKNGYLQTRFEMKLIDQNDLFGADKTVLISHNADMVIDAANGQRLRVWSGAGTEKMLEFGNHTWGNTPRWMIGSNNTTESGSNVGSDFELRRYNDAGVTQGTPISVKRSSGRTTIGGADGSQSGMDVNRNAAGNAILATTTAVGGVALAHVANDTTSKIADVKLSGDSISRFVAYADGKHEWGSGAGARDVNLYRSAADVLKTDDTFMPASGIDMSSADIVTDTVNGTKIGTAASQKVGLFGATPVVQQSGLTDLGVALSNLGLRSAGTAYTLTTSGQVTFSGLTILSGGYRQGVQMRTADTTVAVSTVEPNMCSATTASFVVTLPSAGTNGTRFTFKKQDVTANTVTIQTVSAQTIDGSTTYVLATQYKYVTIISDGTRWNIIGGN